MKVPTWLRLVAALALVFAVAACGGDDGEETGGSPSAPAEGGEGDGDDGDDGGGGEAGELTITAEDYSFDVGEEIEGGIVELTLANEGEFTHEAGFIKVADGYDIESFEADFGPVIEGGPIPDDFETVTGVGDTEPGAETTSTVTLPEGEYVLFCSLSDTGEGDAEGEGEEDAEGAAEGVEEGEEEETGPPPHFSLGMMQTLTVTSGADLAATDIESDGIVQAVDYGFEMPELEAGEHTLTFENTSDEQIHHGIFFEFAEGVDEAAAREAFQALMSEEEGAGGEGGEEPEEVGFTYVFGPGMAGTFDVELQSGRTYGVVCFLQDREGGPPHAIAHDMVDFFTVE